MKEDISHLGERYGFDAHQAITELESFVSCYLDDDSQSKKAAGQEVTVATGHQQQPDSSSGNESEDDGRWMQ